MESAVVLSGVTKTFGNMTALDDVHLRVPRGSLYGLIGPNGAGKTTSIRIIMSILFPDRGEVSVLGHRSALDAKQRIGYLPEERGVYRKMRVGAFLGYIAALKGVSSADIAARVPRLLEQVDLAGTARKRCDELSKGMLQRVQLVAAMIHEPDLLILDEPFSGLDPVSTRLLRDIVLERHRQGVTILFSTHAMAQAEELCEHIVMIHRGAKVLDEPVAALRRHAEPRTIAFEPMQPDADLAPLRALPEVARIEPSARGYDIVLATGVDPGAAVRRIATTVTPSRIELARVRLEDVFVRIVSGSDAARAGDDGARLRAELQAAGRAEEGAAR